LHVQLNHCTVEENKQIKQEMNSDELSLTLPNPNFPLRSESLTGRIQDGLI